MNRPLRSLSVATVLLAAVGLAGCMTAEAAPVAPGQALAAGTVLIDVRTPAEFAEGHLVGAVNVPVESPDFAAAVAALDPDAEYLVYCRSGRRSAIAVDAMRDVGLAVVDLGAVDRAVAATGLTIVR
jgi:phage shock protein E